MIPMRQPEVLDAIVWWVHARAVGDRMAIPVEAQRFTLGGLALLTMAPAEIISEMKSAEGGLGELGDRLARRLAALSVKPEVITASSAEATRRLAAKADTLFMDAPAAPPASAQDTIPEPPPGDVEAIQAYHAFLNARTAYLRRLSG